MELQLLKRYLVLTVFVLYLSSIFDSYTDCIPVVLIIFAYAKY